MGRVFSYEEIQARLIPNEEDFIAATEAFRASTERAVEQGELDGGIIFGSTAIGAVTIRSDFDCMVTPRNISPRSIGALQHILRTTSHASRYRIPLNSIKHDRERLSSGDHEVDRFFGAHLSGDHRIVIGNDPAEYIQHADMPGRDILLSYVREKKRKVNELLTPDQKIHDRVRSLQRLLELPSAVGRKALRVFDEYEQSQRAVDNSANKMLVGQASNILFKELGIVKGANELVDLNDFYNEVLTGTLRGTVDEQAYESTLDYIAGYRQVAGEWLDEADRAIQERLP